MVMFPFPESILHGVVVIGWWVDFLVNSMFLIVGVLVGRLLHAISGGHIRGNILYIIEIHYLIFCRHKTSCYSWWA